MAVSLLFSGFTRHPKILRAGEPAAWLFVCMLEYCADNPTNGFVADYVIDGFGLKNVKPRLAKLVYSDAHHGPLLHRVDSGYEVNDYLEWNRSAAELAEKARAKSEQRAAAGKKGAQVRWGGKLHGKPDSKPDGKPIATGWQADSPGSGPGSGSSGGLESPSVAVTEPRATGNGQDGLSETQITAIDSLAAAINALRPGIDRPQIAAALTRMVRSDRSWTRISIAMIACSLDPETKLAARVHMSDGYWWRDSDTRTQKALARWVAAGHPNPARALVA